MGIPIIQMAIIGILPSRLKVFYYRLRGAKIGKRVRIAPLTVIIADEIEIGDDCRIGMLSFIKVRTLRLGNRVKIGNLVGIDTGSVSIGHDSVVMEQTVIGGMLTPRSNLSIGCRVKIFPYCFINPTEPIIIEDDVGVGGGTYLFTHGSWQSVLEGFPIAFGPIHIQRGVWLPWRVFILPNVEIGEEATIGAGAVINRSIPAHSLAAGIPAKVLSKDSQYLNPINDDEKWEKVNSIFGEFCDFQNFLGQKTEVDQTDENFTRVRILSKRNQWSEIGLFREVNSLGSFNSVVSLSKIQPEIARAYTDNKTPWFDIESKIADTGMNPLAEEIRNFFSRFGIRFTIASDPIFGESTRD